MKKTVFILILILLIIKLISSIDPKNYCLRSNTKCSGKYNKACGSDYCTLNSETCSQLVKYNYFIEQILNPKPKIKSFLYEKLVNSIAKCQVPVMSNKSEFKLNKVCTRKINCITKLPTKKRTECLCAAGQYSTPCEWNNKYCSKDQKSCREFESKVKADKSVVLKIKFCT